MPSAARLRPAPDPATRPAVPAARPALTLVPGTGAVPRPRTSPPAGTVPCRTAPADLFFAEEQELVQRAKALCAACPLLATCLAGALERREPAGVWGGQLFVDGVPVAYKRGRGRPRKDSPPVAVVL